MAASCGTGPDGGGDGRAYRQHREREQAGWRLSWRLRFRPSPGVRVRRRQAALQRRTAPGVVVVQLPSGGPPPATLRGLRGQADAVAETLDGWARVPVRPLLCVHSPWSAPPAIAGGIRVSALSQLPGIVRSGPSALPGERERAASRLLEVLRPAA